MDVMDTCSEGEEVRDLGEEDVFDDAGIQPPGQGTPPIPSGPLNATPMLVDGPQSPPPVLPIRESANRAFSP